MINVFFRGSGEWIEIYGHPKDPNFPDDVEPLIRYQASGVFRLSKEDEIAFKYTKNLDHIDILYPSLHSDDELLKLKNRGLVKVINDVCHHYQFTIDKETNQPITLVVVNNEEDVVTLENGFIVKYKLLRWTDRGNPNNRPVDVFFHGWGQWQFVLMLRESPVPEVPYFNSEIGRRAVNSSCYGVFELGLEDGDIYKHTQALDDVYTLFPCTTHLDSAKPPPYDWDKEDRQPPDDWINDWSKYTNECDIDVRFIIDRSEPMKLVIAKPDESHNDNDAGNVGAGKSETETDMQKSVNPWDEQNPNDPPPKHPWYIAARYFARQLQHYQ